MEQVIENPSFKYKGKNRIFSQKKYIDVTPDTSVNTLPLTATSLTSFRIGGSTVNYLGNSKIECELKPAAQANDFVGIYCGQNLIKSLSMKSESSAAIQNEFDTQRYCKLVLPVTTTMSEFHKMGPMVDDGQAVGFARANLANTVNLFGSTISNAGASVASVLNYSQIQNYVTSGADATDVAINYTIPLSLFRHTIFAMKEALFTGEELIMSVTLNSGNLTCFDADDNALANIGYLAAAPTLSGLKLRLATEINPRIVQGLKDRVRADGNLAIQYPVVTEYQQKAIAATTSYTKNIKINSTNGQRLLRYYTGMFMPDGKGVVASNYNRAGVIWTHVRTFFNNSEEQQSLLTRDQYFSDNRYFFEDSVVPTRAVWDDYAVVVRDYTGYDGPGLVGHEKDITGIPLDQEATVGVEWTTANAIHDWHLFAVCQRTLIMTGARTLVA